MSIDRRDFLKLVSFATLNACCATATKRPEPTRQWVAPQVLVKDLHLSDEATGEAVSLFLWLEKSGWLRFLGLDIDPAAPIDQRLFDFVESPGPGFEDAAGVRWIEPGLPQFSLLYHALASPTVQLGGADDDECRYPGLAQIDQLENFIYRLSPCATSVPDGMALAVLAYEYRPAVHTPHGNHADIVCSRTGIGHVGDTPPRYSARKRSHVPVPIGEQSLAVFPARFGLFLVRSMKLSDALDTQVARGPCQEGDEDLSVWVPTRKVCPGDAVLDGAKLEFVESHRIEKLARLFSHLEMTDPQRMPGEFDRRRAPFIRVSADHEKFVELTPLGGSVLVKSIAAPVVRPATQDGARLYVNVPEDNHGCLTGNRRYGTLKLFDREFQEAYGAVWEGQARSSQTINLHAPRNAPMFVNIRHELRDTNVTHLDCPKGIKRTHDGGYRAALFEDNLADGCVTVVLPRGQHVLPGFSIITAPDFLPFASVVDLQGRSDHFLEGDVRPMSVLRLPANPGLQSPASGQPAFPPRECGDGGCPDTVSEVVVQPTRRKRNRSPSTQPAPPRDTGPSYLPDAASGVFYPGWDATFSGKPNDAYIATFALGSPFAEDLKLCAAANGMWPVAAPDAARTYQGSLDRAGFLRGSPTAVPLLDEELGRHEDSPLVRAGVAEPSAGWDGECGPYLFLDAQALWINYADIERVDYVQNILAKKMRPSLIQNLTARQLIDRMEALSACIRCLDDDDVRDTRQWLVSAERVAWWPRTKPRPLPIPAKLGLPPSFRAEEHGLGATGPGYVFVFVLNEGEPVDRGHKRLAKRCSRLAICQVGTDDDGAKSVYVREWETGWKA